MMSMKINENNGYSPIYDVKQPKNARSAKPAEKMDSADKTAANPAPAGQDAYISSEASAARPSGLYRLEQDGDGNRKIVFDDPEKTKKAGQEKQPQAASDGPEKSAERCVGDTGKVDREIKKLKEKQKQLEQQLQSAQAAGNEKKVRELEKKLAQVQSELSQKDHDTYRRNHTSFSQ